MELAAFWRVLLGVRRLFEKSRKSNRSKRDQLRFVEALDELRKFGYHVFHDLRHDGYDLNHVIVGPAGAFAIGTRIQNGAENAEPERRGNRLRAAGESSFAGQATPGRLPTCDTADCQSALQVKKQPVKEKNPSKSTRANRVKVNRIKRRNREFDGWIWPLVVIEGEWRVKNDLETAEARLFTIDKLVNHVVNQPARLTSTEIRLIASHLERSANSVVRFKKKTTARRNGVKAHYLKRQES